MILEILEILPNRLLEFLILFEFLLLVGIWNMFLQTLAVPRLATDLEVRVIYLQLSVFLLLGGGVGEFYELTD